ncbi:hypothetical protein ES703_64182 [subsurface metagenome]
MNPIDAFAYQYWLCAYHFSYNQRIANPSSGKHYVVVKKTNGSLDRLLNLPLLDRITP